jgi:hypothetical protein
LSENCGFNIADNRKIFEEDLEIALAGGARGLTLETGYNTSLLCRAG